MVLIWSWGQTEGGRGCGSWGWGTRPGHYSIMRGSLAVECDEDARNVSLKKAAE